MIGKHIAPCGHEGIPVFANYVTCPVCDAPKKPTPTVRVSASSEDGKITCVLLATINGKIEEVSTIGSLPFDGPMPSGAYTFRVYGIHTCMVFEGMLRWVRDGWPSAMKFVLSQPITLIAGHEATISVNLSTSP